MQWLRIEAYACSIWENRSIQLYLFCICTIVSSWKSFLLINKQNKINFLLAVLCADLKNSMLGKCWLFLQIYSYNIIICIHSMSTYVHMYLFLIWSKLNDKCCIHARCYFISNIQWTNDFEIWWICLCYLHQTCNLKHFNITVITSCY